MSLTNGYSSTTDRDRAAAQAILEAGRADKAEAARERLKVTLAKDVARAFDDLNAWVARGGILESTYDRAAIYRGLWLLLDMQKVLNRMDRALNPDTDGGTPS